MQPENDRQSDQPRTLAEHRQTLIVIWGALLFSQLFFVSMLFFMKNELFRIDLAKPLDGGNPVLVLVFVLLSATTLILSFVMKKRMIEQAIAEQNVGLLQSGLILAYALCESISLCGFLLAFLIEYQYFFVWFAAGILGIILHFPKEKYLLAVTYKK